MVTITNSWALTDLDLSKPVTFEVVQEVDGVQRAIAVLPTRDCWQKFANEHDGAARVVRIGRDNAAILALD